MLKTRTVLVVFFLNLAFILGQLQLQSPRYPRTSLNSFFFRWVKFISGFTHIINIHIIDTTSITDLEEVMMIKCGLLDDRVRTNYYHFIFISALTTLWPTDTPISSRASSVRNAW